MTNPTDPGAYSWSPPADTAILDSFQIIGDLQPYIDEVNREIKALVALTIPPDDLAHQQIPTEGTE